MRRWNGWGDDQTDYQLPESASRYLESLVGPGCPPQDALFSDVLGAVPPSRLPDHALITKDPQQRLRHARGQSLPDLIALRSGQIGVFPDGAAFPSTAQEVSQLLAYAQETGSRLIPYGGGTSVLGHINPLAGDAPVLVADMSRMNQLVRLDEDSQVAVFGAGIAGPDLEAHLRARGFTLGHFPQSFELSTLGGWIATRSSGQQSLRYGRIEKLFAGGRLVSPAGVLDLPPFPASAAGPDLRELVLGSEGRMGILTEAAVRISRLPESESFHGIFFPDFESGMAAARRIMQDALPLSMLRLSTPSETATTLALAGHENLIGLLEGLLSIRGLGAEKCLLLAGFTGKSGLVRQVRHELLDIVKAYGGVHVGRSFGEQWQKSRFRTPYLRNTLWEKGYAVDTLETAVAWSQVPQTIDAIEGALYTALADSSERVHVFTHLSHLYPYGSSIYTTYLFRLGMDAQESLHRWRSLKRAASLAVVGMGGTISHQHGVGLDHKEYLVAEKGRLGVNALSSLFKQFDPEGLMNPGKLVDP
jgi:alkyldihydroxyacetonephosphate synthase